MFLEPKKNRKSSREKVTGSNPFQVVRPPPRMSRSRQRKNSSIVDSILGKGEAPKAAPGAVAEVPADLINFSDSEDKNSK